MKYRLMRREEAQVVNEVISSTGYYAPVDVGSIGGMVLVAEDDGVIAACVWVVPSGEISFCDYLAVLPEYQHTGVGIRLQIKMAVLLGEMGVKSIRFWVHESNKEALKMHDTFGSYLESGYRLGVFILGDRYGN